MKSMNTLPSILCLFFLHLSSSANTIFVLGEGLDDPSIIAQSNDPSNTISFYMHDVLDNQPYKEEPIITQRLPNNNQENKPDLPTTDGRADMEGLEFGPITAIDQALYQYLEPGSPVLIGSAQGIYVASSDDGVGHYMVAIKASFSNGDGLKFFGVHQVDTHESHIAVVGGTGKYRNANGYASVKTLDLGSNGRPYKLLLFNVHLG
ncbi:dirigent protein 25-like [Impatiens glandulifera]|uniref:dirigent protein 25-like n=1 Tax=Impatiens glandulifera TaxID=253017 RepID=UPI001FB08456|nr:dirigent protein 25-like [Impatiens glandulifera]